MHDATKYDAYGRVKASYRASRALAAADITDAPDWATQLAARRKITRTDKANAASRLQDEHGWSQIQVAKLFGVTRQAVQQWLTATLSPEELARQRADRAFRRQQTIYQSASHERVRQQKVRHGLCYLCQRPLGPGRMSVIEHDHRCCPADKSCRLCRRGLACTPCNHLIGLAEDDPDRLELIAGNLRTAKTVVTRRLAEAQS
jgi:predicted transcriptional regulator